MATATKTISQKIREESFSNGFSNGGKNKSIEIAKNLLDILDNEMVSLKTGLPIEQVEKLRQDI